MNQTQSAKEGDKKLPEGRIDRLSAGAFAVYLILFLVGVLVNYIYPLKIDGDIFLLNNIGVVLVIAGPALILWSQSGIRRFRDEASGEGPKNFANGPYRFMRNPTYFGLTLLVIGFGFFANAAPVLLSSLLSYLIVRSTFLTKEERLLAEKYDGEYRRYMEKVKRWF
jgi:protein-S-isoprenylcysteine O-methyltransferase Ste14